MESIQFNDEFIRSLKTLKYLRKDTSNITFEIGAQRFNVVIPKDSDSTFFIELPVTLTGYEWLNRVNEFIFSKQPTLDRLLKYIETQYDKNKKTTDVNICDIPDLNINQFDLQEQRYRKEVEKKIPSCKSTLTMNTDTNKAPVLFSGKTPAILMLNSFFDLRKKNSGDKSTEITLVNDNIYHWNIKFRNFNNKALNEELQQLNKKYGYDYIELEAHLHDKLYPGYPPFVRVVRPRLNNSLMHRITNMRMIQFEYWSPIRGMDFIVNKLRAAFNTHGSIDYDSEMNDITKYKSGAYHDLESILIKLASLCDVKDEFEPLDSESYEKMTGPAKKQVEQKSSGTSRKSESGTVWKQGTGYGHGGSSTWDPNEYVRLQQEKDAQIQSVLNTIIDNLQNYPSDELPIVYKILSNSYILPFIKSYLRGTNMLEMGKHVQMYNLLFTFMQLLVTDQSIFIFDVATGDGCLYDFIKILYNEANQVIKMTKNIKDEHDDSGEHSICLMICTLFEMIDPLLKAYRETRSKLEEEEKKKWVKKMEDVKNTEDPVKLKYKEIMNDLKFDTCKFVSNFYHQQNGPVTDKNTIKRLAREHASLMNSLPIYYESSIFVRVDENDNSRIKVLITGPDGTPYDSGCFIFDVYAPNGYPNDKPKMQFRNHGQKRFNPNLYNCGKVCLSLLGTWQGSGGETWNPQTSTLQQLFISVQSQILIDQPYFNEPGYEARSNNNSGMETSRQYNNERRWYTLCHAMYDLITNPKAYPEFEDVIKNHFKLKKDYIIKLCDKWVAEPNNQFSQQTKEMAEKVKAELNKLN
ncbi:ubiquitin-conjugating enzyme E2 [Fadolivirus algeromassiliense]|jgi:baculoviral IAP repeat-containing protein 6|uniref:E2 ubiquitin-conjugating enzyme n=1 Tax=Fadolivirus FV1/VV64 TaxID=3070911 RepID=A0A7D3UUP2_9VIRU|nr:ubiquitin-conjugating enzyme E2 [Fadolivirus algeromassiliense]QKF93649.1 ubiquitin-conjugating enzyme E2 [Fadolivirus FV1/VV64]